MQHPSPAKQSEFRVQGVLVGHAGGVGGGAPPLDPFDCLAGLFVDFAATGLLVDFAAIPLDHTKSSMGRKNKKSISVHHIKAHVPASMRYTITFSNS